MDHSEYGCVFRSLRKNGKREKTEKIARESRKTHRQSYIITYIHIIIMPII